MSSSSLTNGCMTPSLKSILQGGWFSQAVKNQASRRTRMDGGIYMTCHRTKTKNHSSAQRNLFRALHYLNLFNEQLEITSSPRDSELSIALNYNSGSDSNSSDLSDSSGDEVLPVTGTTTRSTHVKFW